MKKIAAIVASGALMFTLGACSDQSNDYDAVCIDQNTNQRVPDSACGNYGGGVYPGFYPYYYPVWVVAPAIGYPVTTGGYRSLPPQAHMTKTRVPTTGGAPKPKAAPKPATPKTNTGSNNTKPKSTYNQPPKGNGGAYKPPASAPKPAAPAPKPASPPKMR